MAAEMSYPLIETYLPDFMDMVQSLAQKVQTGEIVVWESFVRQVRAFFVPAQMARIEQVAPGWQAMSSQAEGVTLFHVTAVQVALQLCPEFQSAPAGQQGLMKWVVLFHDIAKQVRPGLRDAMHAFRSAVLAARALPHLGFDTRPVFDKTFPAWSELTWNAGLVDETGNIRQDDSKLPQILSGLDQLFGPGVPAVSVVRTILLHLTVNALADWSSGPGLSESQVRNYFDHRTLSMLRLMMLADSDAWQLFDTPTLERYHREIIEHFTSLAAILGE